MTAVLITALTVAPDAQAKKWPNHPFCNTYKCVKKDRQRKQDRKARCIKHSWRVGASVYGPQDGSGVKGYRGDHLPSASAGANNGTYAELGMGWALGGLSYLQRLDIIYQGRVARAYKRDVGLGGGAVRGYRRALDLWHRTAAKLRLGFTLAVVRVTRHRCY